MQLMKFAAATAAALSIGIVASSAQSATVITMAIPDSPFSGTNPFGGVPVLALNKADTYNFTFSLVPPLAGDTVTQVEAQLNTRSGGVSELIRFDLYSGTPTGSHSYIATSPLETASLLSLDLTAGNYFIQIKPSYIAKTGEVDSGSVTTVAVPEPAGWALMIVGIAAVGGALRARPCRVSAEA